jgi:hydroxymethylglutaryl-CoA reductase (NADPH)
MKAPAILTQQLYAFGSLRSGADAFDFALDNRLGAASLTRVVRLGVDGTDVPLDAVELDLGGGTRRMANTIGPAHPAELRLRERAQVRACGRSLAGGRHRLDIALELAPWGLLELEVADDVAGDGDDAAGARGVPYHKDPAADATAEAAAARRRHVAERTGATLANVAHFAFDPTAVRGSVESFVGVAQVPLGVAGPLRVNGEHAQGDFLIPLATTEGTLVASYNRGMKVLTLAGGVTCTVSSDAMQRAPGFAFDSARDARAFRDWVAAHLAEIRAAAEATSHVARLLHVEPFLASRFAYLRFSYATGEAAGQNMVGLATLAACRWILANAPGIRDHVADTALASEKRHSFVNMLHPRGKHVTAEAVVPRALLRTHLRVEPEAFFRHSGMASLATQLAGTTNNGLHAPNAISAMFVATGQDVANVTEAGSVLLNVEPTASGDLYLSLTIPSLIVATHGGGTGLPTQRECLSVLGCDGPGSARKLAEIVAAVALAGELSLASAIMANEWVSAHERLGRHR